MPCYCNEISRITHDISVLRQMQSELNSIASMDSTIKSNLSSLSSAVFGAATPSNRQALATKLSELHDREAQQTTSMQTRVTSEISRLQTLLTSLKAQDKSYHKAQADKAKDKKGGDR